MEEGKKKKRGPKGPSKPMGETVFNQLLGMIRIHCTQPEICNILDMSEQTLNVRLKERGYKNYRDCYTKHSSEGRASLRRMQWKSAEDGIWNAQKWLGIQLLNQKERADFSSEDGSMATYWAESERATVDFLRNKHAGKADDPE